MDATYATLNQIGVAHRPSPKFTRNADGNGWKTELVDRPDYYASVIWNRDKVATLEACKNLCRFVNANDDFRESLTYRIYGSGEGQEAKAFSFYHLFGRIAGTALEIREDGGDWEGALAEALQKTLSQAAAKSAPRIRTTALYNVQLPNGPLHIGDYILRPPSEEEMDDFAGDGGLTSRMWLPSIGAVLERRVIAPLDQTPAVWPRGWENDLLNILRLRYDCRFFSRPVHEWMDSFFGVGVASGITREPPPTMLARDTPVDLNPGDEGSLNELWQAFLETPADRYHTAWNRWRTSHEREDDADTIIDFWIALESLFGDSQSSEISFKLSLRVAAWIGESPEARVTGFKECRQAYGKRSSLVHGRITDANVLRDERIRVRGYLVAALTKLLRLRGKYDTTSLETQLLKAGIVLD